MEIKKNSPCMYRGHYYYYITVAAGYINPPPSPTTNDPKRGRPIRIARATPRTPQRIRDETRGTVKMYFAPPVAAVDDHCACVRKRGTRSARRPIVSTAQLPAATTSAAIAPLASDSTAPIHHCSGTRARAYDSARSIPHRAPPTSHLRRAERASQRRARVDKRSLSSALLQYTLDSPTRLVRLFIYYYIRHPHPVAPHIYIHR